VFALPPLDGVFAGLGCHLTGQAKNPLSRVNICDAIDRVSEWTYDSFNLLVKQHWSVFLFDEAGRIKTAYSLGPESPP
jgi:hypothetical protein